MLWDSEKAKFLLSLIELAANRERIRRDYEWKFFLGVWASLGSIAGVLATSKHFEMKETWLYALGIFCVGVFVVAYKFTGYIQKSGQRDRREQYFWLSGIERMTGIAVPSHLRPPYRPAHSETDNDAALEIEQDALPHAWARVPEQHLKAWVDERIPRSTQLDQNGPKFTPLPESPSPSKEPAKPKVRTEDYWHSAGLLQLTLTALLLGLVFLTALNRFSDSNRAAKPEKPASRYSGAK